jgi:integrase
MADTALTSAALAGALKRAGDSGKDVWLSDDGSNRGGGRLRFRAMPNGAARWMWRYSVPNSGGKTKQVVIGVYSREVRPGFCTLREARAEVAKLVELYRRPESRDVRAFQQAEAKAKAAARAASVEKEASEARAAEDAKRYTLGKLMDAYVSHLMQQGRGAAYDVGNMTKNHLLNAHPAIAAKTARLVTAKDIATILRALVDEGKGRTAAKFRSYLRAAFALAARAETDGGVPGSFIAFGVETNPVAVTGALAQYNKTRERALSESEVRTYYQAIKALKDSATKCALLLGLQLGGQRMAQLLRVSVADVDLSENTVTLRDPKGKRQQVRRHVLPLTEAARAVVVRCIERSEALLAKAVETGGVLPVGPVPLFTNDGVTHVTPETVIGAAGKVAAALLALPKPGRVVNEAFRLGDIRRTCETRLAALGVSKDVRAQLQSHGLSGVQSRHYDRHDYIGEKRAALETWAKFLEQSVASNVRSIRGKRVASPQTSATGSSGLVDSMPRRRPALGYPVASG